MIYHVFNRDLLCTKQSFCKDIKFLSILNESLMMMDQNGVQVEKTFISSRYGWMDSDAPRWWIYLVSS